MENFERTFTVVCLEEGVTDVNIGVYSFKSQEGVEAFVTGRKLVSNAYAVIAGPVIKQMHESKINYPKKEE
jgi:hypothetical protein